MEKKGLGPECTFIMWIHFICAEKCEKPSYLTGTLSEFIDLSLGWLGKNIVLSLCFWLMG